LNNAFTIADSKIPIVSWPTHYLIYTHTNSNPYFITAIKHGTDVSVVKKVYFQ